MIDAWIMQQLPVISIAFSIAPMLIVLGLRGYVYLATWKFRYRDATEVPEKPVAIVFGAGVWADGTPCPMLADRIHAAVELYQLRRVKKLLMSGDRSSPDYDEVTVMKGYAENLGIPTADILLDYAGFSTYETCHRAQKIFGITEAVLVTQNFHLPRAVYTCRQMGVEAIGLGTRDWGWYGSDSVIYHTVREIVATVKAIWQVHMTRSLIMKD